MKTKNDHLKKLDVRASLVRDGVVVNSGGWNDQKNSSTAYSAALGVAILGQMILGNP